jgi:hypothetical protein
MRRVIGKTRRSDRAKASIALVLKALIAAVACAQVPHGSGSLAGVWANSDYDRGRVFDPRRQVLRTADGKMPPLQPWAAELLEKRLKDAEEGKIFPTTLSQCLPSGVPAMMFYPGLPIQILETPGQVTMLNEQFTNWRLIYLDAQHDPDPDPSFFGDSIGHWEGDTLVVDTLGLTTRTALDQPGMPHSDALHVVERYRRTGAKTLELLVTIDDPKVFTAAWTAVTHFELAPADRRIEEYICENNRQQ